jgi:glutathione S-transferase
MKLYRFNYSPFARKVQAVLDLLGRKYEAIEVAFDDRAELARVSGGVMVPVLVDDDGRVVRESRAICEHLLAGEAGAGLVPAPWEGPIWGYADFCDGPLEDILFRVASPAVRDLWKTPHERAMFTFIKERKFGPGCIDAWERDRHMLLERGRELLAPTLKTLAARPFLFGDAPTLADAALYGLCAMLREAGAGSGEPRQPGGEGGLLPLLAEALVPYARRVEAQAARAGR